MARIASQIKEYGSRFAKANPWLVIAALIVASLPAPATHAASLTAALVRFDRMQTSTATTGTVCATPTSTATEASVQVTFPTGYTLGTAANFTVNTTNTAWPSGATAWLGINTATNVTGQVVTFPSSDLTASTLYCFNWINSAAVQVTSSVSASNVGSITTQTSVPAAIDTASYSTASVSSDQISVSATVPSTFSFTLSGTSDALGTLSTSSIVSSPTPRTTTINTNARNGWQVWAKDANTGLTSSTTSTTIASKTPGTNSTLVTGSAAYNTGVTSTQVGGSGTISIAAPFVGSGAGQGGGLDTTLRSVATSNGTADTAVLTFKNNVTIGATTPAANDYSDTITIIGAGLF